MRAGSEPGHKECEGSTGEMGGDRDVEEQRVEIKSLNPSGNIHRNQNPSLQMLKTLQIKGELAKDPSQIGLDNRPKNSDSNRLDVAKNAYGKLLI